MPNKTLVVGSAGFIGNYLMAEVEADELDLKYEQDVRNGIDENYKTIIFLACNQDNTQEAYKENYEMYLALDRYRDRRPKTHLIYISTAAVYTPNSIYAQSKRLGEVYAKRFKRHTILRLSNVYGHGDGHGAPDRFQRGEKTIHGDGSQVRDLIPVEEVVDKIIEYSKTLEFGVFNISSGVGTDVNQMFALFGKGKQKYENDTPCGIKYSVLPPGRVNG